MSSIKIISSATSDLVTEQRVHRICKTLQSEGFEIQAVRRIRSDSLLMGERSYNVRRLKPFFEKGPFFYLEFNLRLFFYLLNQNVDVLLSNDLDTLLANTLVSKIKGIPLVYDSHEYFTEVPELSKRPFVKSIWTRLERYCMKSVRSAMTVSESIAKIYSKAYGIEFQVVRNLPESQLKDDIPSKIGIKLQEGEKVLLYQGAVNVDRGLEELVRAMEFLENCKLFILGSGDICDDLIQTCKTYAWGDRIVFLGRLPFDLLPGITVQADLGFSLEKKNGLSYTFAMPNKVFDYVQAGVPVLFSDLPELIKINEVFHFGLCVESHDPKIIAEAIKNLLNDETLYKKLKENCLTARKELNWEKEAEKVKGLFSDFRDRA